MQKLTLGQWIAAGIGMFLMLFTLRDIMPPGTLGLPGFLLSGAKGAFGALIGIFAYEGIRNIMGLPPSSTGEDDKKLDTKSKK